MSDSSASGLRGRPRTRKGTDTRTRIIRAAVDEFAEHGYEAASLRAIARRANVDAALVHHYFKDKADLFTSTVGAPIRPDKIIAAVLSGPRSEIGAGIVRAILQQLAKPKTQPRMIALIRTAIGHSPASRLIKEYLVQEIFLRLARTVDGQDAELRATLTASQVIGLLITRYVLKLEPLASARDEEVVARIGPVIQWYLVDADRHDAPGIGPKPPQRAQRGLDNGPDEGK